MTENQQEASETQPVLKTKSVEEYVLDYQQSMETELPTSMGFSARLNMLWDLAGAAPSQIEGRVISVLAIHGEWRETELRKWLQKDVLPPPIELRNMVKFLVSQLEGPQDVRRWEAFLVYGSPIVTSPVDNAMYRQDRVRRDIASMIFAQITDTYEIPPSAYQADSVFQRCLTLMQKFNIYELRDFQPGHMEPFKNYLFPSE
jgi:hypothetical protein